MRFLTVLVVGLGVLIVAAAGLLAWGLFSKTRLAAVPSPATPAVVNLDLPKECSIRSATAAGETVLVHIQGNDPAKPCDKILIVDWAKGRVLGQIDARKP